MDVNILGPLEIRSPDGREIRLPSGRERSLLILLVIRRGEVVSTDRMIEALWGNSPPETAAKALQGYVSHLRRALEPVDGPGDTQALIVTQAPGYVLRLDAAAVDAARFERLAAEGHRALEDGAPAEAAHRLDEALALWRGEALAEFAYDDFARDEIQRLEQLRLSATEDRVDALLRLGRHGELTGQLETLVAAHPLRERLRGQWMLALYRSGRQADALEAYRDGRRLLAGELGLEPSPELQRLERAILAQDPALDAPAPVATPRAPDAPAEQPPPPGAVARRSRRPIAVIAALAAAVLAALAGVLVLTRGGTPAPVKVVAPAVAVIDAKTNRVVDSIPVGPAPLPIVSGAGGIWVGDVKDGIIRRIDPATRRVTPIAITAPAIGLATGLGSVWVATGSNGTIVRIDPGLARVTDVIDLGSPDDPIVPTVSSVALSDGKLWVGAFAGLAEVDPTSGTVLKEVDLGGLPALQLAVGGHAIWATLQTQRAGRVEVSTGRRSAAFYAGTYLVSLARDRTAVWLGGASRGELWKLDPATGLQIYESRVGRGTFGVALGAGSVWVASWKDRSLYRVDPATGDVQATIPLAGQPNSLVVRDGLVWVTVQGA